MRMQLLYELQHKVLEFKSAMEEAEGQLSTLNARLSDIHSELQDIVHMIEAVDFNASEGYKLAKEMQTLRRERRDIKNTIDLIEKLLNKNSSHSPFSHHIERMTTAVKHKNDVLKSPYYIAKIRKDWQDKFDELAVKRGCEYEDKKKQFLTGNAIDLKL